ncbi:50S ribosomal protein L29 [Nitrosomonas sp. sh817]|jgi:large subunit ribosomal protein L29|uniref:50S ribosomal protein L29 n=1 Tax=Nitrosomonas sp. sh817 TaxID=3070658 RepID=UPI0027DC8674|nr:50S ribosomal protein L29 [Nitrosomonas sp. sh817]WMJ08068.1 50S ribosomal protein L29 [Nitrosomonas sp. sh817]
MRISDMRVKELHELNEELMTLLKIQFSLRMRHATQQLSNTQQIKKNRKDIARLKTLIAQKKNYEE